MFEKGRPRTRLSRRDFLKAGLAGAGGLCLGGSLGCGTQSVSSQERSEPFTQMGFMRPREAAWFSPLEGSALRCELCPHGCELAEGERSLCRVRENRHGRPYTLAYDNPVLVQEDPVER